MGNRTSFLQRNTIIFDMDGTLIDSIGIWNQVDQALMAAMGGAAEEEMAVGRRRDAFLADHGNEENPYLSYCLFWPDTAAAPGAPKRYSKSAMKSPGISSSIRWTTRKGRRR